MNDAQETYPPVERVQAEVTGCREVARSTLLIGLQAPEICQRASPGQFVMLGPLREDACDPFLNRPFSIHRCTGDGQLELLVAVVGRGTGMLGSLEPGDRIWTLGPLGNGFALPEECTSPILVGGGLGIAPLFFLADRLASRGKRVRLLYGATSRDFLVSTGDLESAGVQVRMATDDGSFQTHGTAVDLLAAELQGLSAEEKSITCLAACGPEGMLQAADRLVRSVAPGMHFEVSLEIRMACGMGACMGCTVFLADGSGQRVCCEGPVFKAGKVFGDEQG